jgi:peptidoglycan/LPS O-acetylase OafA/YrhL
MLSVGLVVTFYVICALALFFLPVRRLLGLCFFYQDGSRTVGYAYLDALRGLAALSVMLMHYYIWNTTSLDRFASIGLIAGGQRAVGVFFVLSSFLIWKSLPLDQIGKYAIGRVLRISPLHVAITCFVFLPANAFFSMLLTGNISALSSFWQTNAPFLKEALLLNVFTDNFVLFNGVAWSIVVEMQFYLVAPVLKYAHSIFPRFFVASLILSSAGLLWLESNATILGINSPQLPWLKFFVAGIFLAIFMDRLINSNAMRNSYASAACIVAAMCIIDLDFNNIRVISYILPLGSFTFSPDLAFGVCLLIASLRANAYATRLLSLRSVRFLGVISYSFYLSQLPILGNFVPEISASAHPIAFVLFFAIPFHIVISALLFLVVETPFLMLSAWIKTRSRDTGLEHLGAELQPGMTPP